MTRPTVATARLALPVPVLVALALAGPVRADDPPPAPGKATVFVGTYTDGANQGIYRFAFDPRTGEPGPVRLAAKSKNPSFLAVAPGGRSLYAVSEVDAGGGQPGGAVSGFAVNPETGDLTPLNQQSSGGAGPCHLVVDKAGKNVLAANYGGGNGVVLPIGPDGRLGERSAFFQHTGSSVNPGRQKEPHAHSINLDPANRFAFVADLGLDKVLIYKFDPARGTLTPNDPPYAQTAPGAGPRHFAFHTSGKFAYAIDELDSTVTAWTYDPDRGALSDLQTISTLPEGVSTPNYPADVHAHPSGRFLYGSNRGHDSIVAYAIDPASGRLTLAGHQGLGVKNPRNFAIDPTGRFLLVANQDLDTVVVFRVDPDSGRLSPTGHTLKVPKPVCLKFWR